MVMVLVLLACCGFVVFRDFDFLAGPAVEAALSHALSQRGEELIAADRPAFDDARNHQHIR